MSLVVTLSAMMFAGMAMLGFGLLWTDRVAARALVQRSAPQPHGRANDIAETAGERFAKTSFGSKVAAALIATGFDTSPLASLAAGGAVAGLLLLLGITLNSLFATILMLTIGAGLVIIVSRTLRAKRLRRINEQLPYFSRQLANFVAAGLSVPMSISQLAADLEQPLRGEIERVQGRLTFGTELDDALEEFSQRVRLPAVSHLVDVLILQNQLGGKLATTLRVTADGLTERLDAQRQFLTTLAVARSPAFLVVGMGVLAVLLTSLTSAATRAFFFGNVFGIGILIVCLSIYAAGLLIVKSMTRSRL